MTNALHQLAGELARAVVRGRLTPTQAYATLALRDVEHINPAWDSFVSHARLHNREREYVGWQIYHTVAPMIRRQRPKSALLAEAHGINGEHGFFYAEDEISPLVAGFVRDVIEEDRRRKRWARAT